MRRLTDVEALDVYRGDDRVGTLERTEHGARFVYDDAFLDACGESPGIAFHLPASQRVHETQGVNLHPYFAGLLPEGLRLAALLGRVRTSADDLFTLLAAAGWDAVGDVATVPAGEAFPQPAPVDVRRLHEMDFGELLRRSLNEEARTLEDPTVPGVQPKLSGAMISFPLRRRGAPGHLLKLSPPSAPLLVENEAFFLRVADACGIPSAQATVVHDRNGCSGLLVERFDRLRGEGGTVLKAHLEDACQFLDRYPADKYRLTMRELFEGLASWSAAPRVDGLRLLRRYAFAYAIGDADLHAKNVSLWRSTASGLVELSPAYDVLSTLPYRHLERRMALRLDAKDDRFKRADFLAFGERHDLPARAVDAMLDDLTERVSPWVARFAEIGFEDGVTQTLAKAVATRLARLR